MATTETDLSIATKKVCFIIQLARELDVRDVAIDPDSGSNSADEASVLESQPGNPVQQELTAFIDGLDEDEQIDLVALARLGRGDDTLAEWEELRDEAARQHNSRTAAYLLGMPLLADFLEEALAKFELSCDDL